MAKYTNSTVTNFSDVNTELQKVASAIEDALDREGAIPNQMEADFDLNSNDILNVSTVSADALILGGLKATTSLVSTELHFETIAGMVSNTELTLNDWVSVQDYAVGNNSGYLFFKVVAAATGTADGGSFIDLPNTTPALQAKQNFPTVISIKMFGAPGGGADSVTHAQATIDYVNANSKGIVFAPADNYGYSANHVLKSNVEFVGEGYDTLFTSLGADLRCFQNENRTAAPIVDENIIIRDLRVDNNATGSTSEFSHCFDTRFIRNHHISNVWCTNAKGDGVSLRGNENYSAKLIHIDSVERQGVVVTLGDNGVIDGVFCKNHQSDKAIVDIEPNVSDTITGLSIHNVYSEDASEGQVLNLFNGNTRGDLAGLNVSNIHGKNFKMRGIIGATVSNLHITSITDPNASAEIHDCSDFSITDLFMLNTGADFPKVKISSSDNWAVNHLRIAGPGGSTNVDLTLLTNTNGVINGLDVTDSGLYGINWRDCDNVTVNDVTINGSSSAAIRFDGAAGSGNTQSVINNLKTPNNAIGVRMDAGANGDVTISGDVSGATIPFSASGSSVHTFYFGNLVGYSPIFGETVWDPPNVVAGLSQATNFTVTGAINGDAVTVFPPYNLSGMTATGYVNAANTVAIVLFNPTAGDLDKTSGTWKVKLERNIN